MPSTASLSVRAAQVAASSSTISTAGLPSIGMMVRSGIDRDQMTRGAKRVMTKDPRR
jgi:hypothetical protein